jgi:hypothetical protein
MLGSFQTSQLRIELSASEVELRRSLTYPQEFRQWMWPQDFSADLPEQLYPGVSFVSSFGGCGFGLSGFGLVRVKHWVDVAEPHCLRLILSQGIDGFHEWYWGEGWVQSRLEGVSLLPLNLLQTFGLLRLRQYLHSSPLRS